MFGEFDKNQIDLALAKEAIHFSTEEFKSFLEGNLEKKKRVKIIQHLVKSRCESCISILAEKIIDRMDETDPINGFKEALDLISNQIIQRSSSEFNFILQNKVERAITKNEILADIYEYVCKVNMHYESRYLGIQDYVREWVAVELYDQTIISKESFDMLLNSNSVDEIKVGIITAIFDTLNILLKK